LGTANLCSQYGIANTNVLTNNESTEILNHAIHKGINEFDTSPSYGNAESIVGGFLADSKQVALTTKIPRMKEYTLVDVNASLDKSLEKLRRKRVENLLFHDPEIHLNRHLGEINERLLTSGKVTRLGFSSYNLESILIAKDLYPEWSVFQVSENIADRRLVFSTELADLASKGNRLTIRSVFLQGLLLMKPDLIPMKFGGLVAFVRALQSLAINSEASAVDLCLSYASQIPWNSGTLVGVASTEQLDQILTYKSIEIDFKALPKVDELLLDPRNWNNA
jgi:aryl-alcohol dehydrogenase-like predicted oxidoreductase